jgi:hypothetical protein
MSQIKKQIHRSFGPKSNIAFVVIQVGLEQNPSTSSSDALQHIPASPLSPY